MSRPPLPEREIERIRRERRAPRPTQWDYLHLAGLRHAITEAFGALPIARGPVLDLYCGTKPYLELIPWRPVWGFDIDRHFGRADAIGSLPLPFADGAFSLVFCTQALHLTDDPSAVVPEIRRVLARDGWVVVTVPHIFRREIPAERKYGTSELAALFTGWERIRVVGIGGPGTGLTFYPGSLAGAAARHSSLVRRILPAFALALSGTGIALEAALHPFARRWPASLLLMARRPDD
ncbi:MAG TPA: methyltransferase domain-containing protein [Gemmatimonadaceae bacterium]